MIAQVPSAFYQINWANNVVSMWVVNTIIHLLRLHIWYYFLGEKVKIVGTTLIVKY